jgi:hypothetical protein
MVFSTTFQSSSAMDSPSAPRPESPNGALVEQSQDIARNNHVLSIGRQL